MNSNQYFGSHSVFVSLYCLFFVPSVLWCCWLGGRKGIRPVKNWVVGCWHGYLSGARCRLAYGPANATATHFLASVKSRLVLPFLYLLTWVVPDKGPLNGCACVCVCVCVCVLPIFGAFLKVWKCEGLLFLLYETWSFVPFVKWQSKL